MAVPGCYDLTSRITTLRRRLGTEPSDGISSQRRQILERAYAQHASEPPVLRMARGLSAYLREKDILMWEDDLLAGHDSKRFYDCPVHPSNDAPALPAEEATVLAACRRGSPDSLSVDQA